MFTPKFAAVYLVEKRALLEALVKAWPQLQQEAWEVLIAAERRLAMEGI